MTNGTTTAVAAVAITSLASAAAYAAFQYYEAKEDERKMEECMQSLQKLAKQYARDVIDSVSTKVDSFKSSAKKDGSKIVDDLLTEMIQKLTLESELKSMRAEDKTTDSASDAPPASFMKHIDYPSSSKSAFYLEDEPEFSTEGDDSFDDGFDGSFSEDEYESEEHFKDSFSGEEDMGRVYLAQDITTGNFQDALDDLPSILTADDGTDATTTAKTPSSSTSDETLQRRRKKKNRYGHPNARRQQRGSI